MLTTYFIEKVGDIITINCFVIINDWLTNIKTPGIFKRVRLPVVFTGLLDVLAN